MNEQIRQLAEQADIRRVRTANALVPSGFVYLHTEETLEKFAQMIIGECCDMVNKHLQHNNPNDCLLVLDIKERFGVEE